jgi:hypothetical protein
VKVARNQRVNVTDPSTGAIAPGLTVSGQPVSFVTSDSNGHVSFAATIGTVTLTGPNGFSMNVQSPDAYVEATQAAADAASSANSAAVSAQSAQDSANLVGAPAGSAIAANLKGKGTVSDQDYASLEAALTDLAAGGVLEVSQAWSRSTTFTINKSCTVRFIKAGSITVTSATVAAITVAANDVTLDRPNVTGTGSGASSTGIGITASGTVSAYLTGLRIRMPKVSSFTQYGIILTFCSDFRIERVRVDSIAYAGIVLSSCSDGEVDGGLITNITMPAGLTNAYGLTASRSTTSASELTAFPRSENIIVRNLTVDGVPGWEGLDTHGGKDISFINNTVRNCLVGIALVGSNNNAGTNTYAPLNVIATGNRVYGGVTNGSRSAGIWLVGTATEQGYGVISGNEVVDMGGDAASVGNNSAGIYLEQTRGAVVAHNVIKRPATSGIQALAGNTGLILQANTIEDVWATTAPLCTAVYVRSNPNTVTVGGTQIIRGSKSATLVNNEGLRCNTGATQIDAGGNQWTNATTPVVSGSAAHVASVYGAAPVARAAAIASPTAPSASYVQAEATSMKTAVDAIRTALKNYGITL